MTELPGGHSAEDSLEESNFVKAAISEVDKLIKANRVNQRVIKALVVVSVLIAITCGVLSYVLVDQHNSDNQLRQESIAQCQAGNDYRAGNEAIWLKLFTLSKPPPAGSEQEKLIHEFISYIKQVDAPRNCAQLFNASK